MDDPELEMIRKQRLAQLQAQRGVAAEGGKDQQERRQQERRRQVEEARHSILSQVLSQDARARLNTIKLSRPEKGVMVEDMICRLAQSGQVGARISDPDLVRILESVNQQQPKSSNSVKFDRRRAALDSDDEL